MTISLATLLCGLFGLFVALFGFTVNYIINSFKAELQQDRNARAESMREFGKKVEKVETFLEKISDEIFTRLNKAEKDINGLWVEHDLIKENGGCHTHKRETDKIKTNGR